MVLYYSVSRFPTLTTVVSSSSYYINYYECFTSHDLLLLQLVLKWNNEEEQRWWRKLDVTCCCCRFASLQHPQLADSAVERTASFLFAALTACAATHGLSQLAQL